MKPIALNFKSPIRPSSDRAARWSLLQRVFTPATGQQPVSMPNSDGSDNSNVPEDRPDLSDLEELLLDLP